MDRKPAKQLTRDVILATCKGRCVATRRVSTPEWSQNGHGSVCVRTLQGAALDRVRALLNAQNENGLGEAEVMARWCVLGICDERGCPLFTESDVPALLDGPLAPLHDCLMAIFDMNRLTGHKGDIETSKKAGSMETPSGV